MRQLKRLSECGGDHLPAGCDYLHVDGPGLDDVL